MNKVISILMSTYNEPVAYIKDAIESILNQTYKELQIIIIIDNPNNIDCIKICSEYAFNDNRIKLLVNNKNIGLVKSLNKALRYANGYYVARMDADDISCLDRFEKQIRFIEKNNLDLVAGNMYRFNENGVIEKANSFFPESHNQIAKYLKVKNVVPHPLWLGKREVFNLLEGYRDIEACEDYDFLVRLVLLGYKIGNVPDYILYHRLNAEGISSTKTAMQRLSFNIIRKNYIKGLITPITEYRAFINSIAGKRELKDIENFLRLVKKLNELNGKPIYAFIYMLNIVIMTKEGRLAAINKIREKLLLL